MAIYTYDDFKKKLESSGLKNQFSNEDLKLAEKNADAGMSILSAKQDWMSATTDEARKAANAKAEEVRKSYGGYTGSTDGGSFNLEPLSPNSFQRDDAPSYSDEYKERLEAALSKIENRQPFSYDYESDPVWQSYNKQYTREGQAATEDVLGKSAAMTGGTPSTAAITAAGQTANQYAAAKSDIIPTLYQQAYERAMAEFEADRETFSDIMSADSQAYNKYLTQLDQYNTDRNFDYGQLLDEISSQRANREEDQSLREYEDALKQQQWENDQTLREYEDSLKYQQWEQEMAERKYEDQISYQEWEKEQQLREYEDNLAYQEWLKQYQEREYNDSRTDAERDEAYRQWQKEFQERQYNDDRADAEFEKWYKTTYGGSSGGSSGDTEDETTAYYNAVYDAAVKDMTANGISEQLQNYIIEPDIWVLLKAAGRGEAAEFATYADYVDAQLESIYKETNTEAEE